MKFKWAVFVGILACLGSGAAQAQTNPNLEIGFKPFGSYDGTDIDSVNLYTGDLTVHIPLFSYPQRGTLRSESVMSLNTKMFKVFQNCNHVTGVCNDSWRLNTTGQYMFPLGVSIRNTSFLGPYWTYNTTYSYIYSTTTWDGAVHQMALNTSDNTTYESTDNTGLWNSGTRVLPNYFGIVKQRNGDLASQDTNGNYFSSTNPPVDPVTTAAYFYAWDPVASPVRYHLWTELERKSPSAMSGDSDINSAAWGGGGTSRIDASSAATTEACTANYAAGAARDCIYDTGQR